MATKKKIKKKVITLKFMKAWADKVFSIYIRQRGMDEDGNNTCFTCGVRKPWKQLQNGHYVSRTHLSLRYDERNCNPQCAGCNIFKKGNLETYTIRLMDKYGDGIIRLLDTDRWKQVRYTQQDYYEIVKEYENKRTKEGI
jgi:ribulose bisphosphate carboxylase small subunit